MERLLSKLRPLLDSGLAALVPDALHFCRKHLEEAVPQHPEILSAAESLLAKHLRRFSVTYVHPGARGLPATLEIKGPSDYLEHGSILRILQGVPGWAPRQTGRVGRVALSHEFVRKHGILRGLFLGMAQDAFVQQYFGAALDARYVTDLPGEAEFFRAIHAEDELARQTAALSARLAHVPLFGEVAIRDVVKASAARIGGIPELPRHADGGT